mmetsp:Transcript_95454/g.308056  ORF Transcript_95454/g.308056 Transcript_95454/m.308056 type:complete len:322 (+) Transcript_95454:1165-2130(+)
MFAVMVLRAENCTIFCSFVRVKMRPSASAASLLGGRAAIRLPLGAAAAAPTPALSCSALCSARAGSESQGALACRAARAAACAERSASGSRAAARPTTSGSARNFEGRCRSAPPTLAASSRANPRSCRSSSEAYLTASGSLLAHSMTKALSSLSAEVAPCSAEARRISAASSSRPWSPRSSSLAPARAAPFTLMASSTNSRSPLSAGAASPRSSPLCFTASRTSLLSSRSSGDARCSARPQLGPSTAKTRSRSAWTSDGAAPSCVQSLKTMARQLAWRKLLRLTAEGPGSSPLAGARMLFLSAAWKMAFSSMATPPRPDSS